MNQQTSSPTGLSVAPDFKQVRKYLRNSQQREALGAFIKAGWTPAELGEYARQTYLHPGKTYPTAVSYQIVVEMGPENVIAQQILAGLRAPGYTMPSFNRPVPKRYSWDDPDNPNHTPEIIADVAEIARRYRNRQASWHALPLPDPNEPIPRWLWKRCFRLRNRYRHHSLQDTLNFYGLSGYQTLVTEEAS